MSELETLTKSLIQIVGSLQELISKKGVTQTSLEPQPKLKKTTDMTYNEFIRQALLARKPIEVHSKKANFHLQEDLQLLYSLSQYSQVNSNTFEQIAGQKKIMRTADALKNRYYDHLHKVDEVQMKKIVNWIENQGVQGFMVIDADGVKIQMRDPKEETKKRSRPPGIDTEAKKSEKISKSSKLKNIPVNCKELSEVLKLYSKMVNQPIRYLVEKLDQVSGDLVELDNFIETKDHRILWTAEEDQIIRKGSEVELKVLRRYRGNSIDVRRRYLGLA